MRRLTQPANRLLLWLADPRFFTFGLAWLMLLLVIGTWAQSEIGIYRAQQKYFSLFWLAGGWLPLPGAGAVLAFITAALAARIAVKTRWRDPRQFGTALIHAGAILLLAGGGLTALFAEEGHMVLREGETSAIVRSYHDIELAVIDHSDPHSDSVLVFPGPLLQPGRVLGHETLPFALQVRGFCRNCELVGGAGDSRILRPLPLARDNELNLAGASLALIDGSPATELYSLFEQTPAPLAIRRGDRIFSLRIRKAERALPFQLHLVDFVRRTHPGSTIPSWYSSEIELEEAGVATRNVIRMNEPLRHRGYTFYQASFTADDSGEATVLAVVQNSGRLFPYISSVIVCFGMLLHLFTRLPALARRNRP